jgi:hypothetical protein
MILERALLCHCMCVCYCQPQILQKVHVRKNPGPTPINCYECTIQAVQSSSRAEHKGMHKSDVQAWPFN